MKVLVTGASGMVGRTLSDYLSRKGMEVVPTDVAGPAVSGDLLDSDFVFTKLASLEFDAVVHLAAMTDLKKTIENPKLCFEVNCFGTLNMLELAAKKGVSRFVYASSANIFGAPKKNPVTEASPLAPRVPYDYSKVIGENLVMGYFRSKSLPVTITRSWLLFGEHDQPSRATIRFIRACLAGEPITLFNAGRDKTSPSHAVNYAKLVRELLTNRRAVGEAFNFGGEKPITIRQLAQTVRRLTGSDSKVALAPPRTELERQPQISYPSISKVRRLLGYRHELTLEQGLSRTIDWVKSELRQ
ncbi:MAG: NAD(P)-dependent oxidoreductase [Nitrososphaerota archaeon]|nr:NAD(P)-dependent oxidoreductase [Nitrososphaerota archaeon]